MSLFLCLNLFQQAIFIQRFFLCVQFPQSGLRAHGGRYASFYGFFYVFFEAQGALL